MLGSKREGLDCGLGEPGILRQSESGMQDSAQRPPAGSRTFTLLFLTRCPDEEPIITQRDDSQPPSDATARPATGTRDARTEVRHWTRRTILERSAVGIPALSAAGSALLGTAVSPVASARKPERLRPQPGDELVHAFGDLQHQPIVPSELPAGGPPVLAVPREPGTALVRSGSRLNNLAVVRVSESALPLSSKTQRYAADDLIVFSAVCTHTGCTVEKWNAEAQHLVCPCHQSEFKVSDAARVVTGPAPKPLAMLPVSVEGDRIIVAGKFSRRVGMQPQQ